MASKNTDKTDEQRKAEALVRGYQLEDLRGDLELMRAQIIAEIHNSTKGLATRGELQTAMSEMKREITEEYDKKIQEARKENTLDIKSNNTKFLTLSISAIVLCLIAIVCYLTGVRL